LVILVAFSAVPTFAGTVTVTNNADSGAGSLRDAIASALPGDTINFSPALLPATITLSSMLTISKNLTISGPGVSNLVVIDGGTNDTVIEIDSGTTVAISGLTIQHGLSNSGYGGGILNNGTLTLNNSTVSSNYAAIAGDGIYNATGGTLTVTNSTLSGNPTGKFAAVACKNGFPCPIGGGGIYNAGTVIVTNSTLSFNSATGDGGGIYNDSEATLSLTDSTLFGNGGGAIKACTPGFPCFVPGASFPAASPTTGTLR
jgi:hypothetical protein